MKEMQSGDEKLSNGLVDIIKSGKIVSIRNQIDDKDYKEFIGKAADEYESSKLEASKLIAEIRELISLCNPLELLKYGYDRFIEASAGVAAEVNLSIEDVHMSREIEYIQSVLVSSENKYNSNENNIDYSQVFKSISSKINKLYSLTQLILFYRTAKLIEDKGGEVDLDLEKFLIEAQSNMFIRGDRYQIYEIPHLKSLLEAHNEELIKLYGISTDDFIEGMVNIQKSLLSIKNSFSKIFGENFDYISKMINIFEKYEEFEQNELEKNNNVLENDIMEKFIENFNINSEVSVDENIYDNFDLEKITKLPKSLLEDLSYKLNENKYFYNNDYAGYPLIELPVFTKPFISINDKFYCFDYYNLFDNIYRVMQKVIRSKDLSYKDKWMSVQMEVTEKMVVDILKKLLPNSTIYTSNYYPKNKSLKQCNENDILVLYDDNLIIIEVKAGSYSYRAPILDIESHINSLKTLVEKADGQAQRTLDYFKVNKKAKLYDSDKNEKCEINIEEFNEITLMSVTLDNFNEFCAKIEKMKFLNINKNSIALSIDDLRVYSDYFDSPLEFLHYLKQRKIATENKNLYLNDELDHLGMYIEHIFYSRVCESEDNRRISAYGFREPLDNYFGSLLNKGFEVEKPKQNIPIQLEKIIKFLGNSKIKNRVKLGTYILDFSPESKEDLNNNICKVLTRQREINRMVQISLMGETPMCVFCHQKNINNMSNDDIEKYTLAHMIQYDEKFRLELNIFYDINNEITDIKFKFHEIENIPEEKVEELIQFGEELFEYRINNYKKQNGIKKIGRNEPCPCGSGKNYTKCHGK